MSGPRIGGPEAALYAQMKEREQREMQFRRVVRALRLGVDDPATLRKHAEDLAAALALGLERSQCYCGEERCGVCAGNRALTAWRSGPGAEDGKGG